MHWSLFLFKIYERHSPVHLRWNTWNAYACGMSLTKRPVSSLISDYFCIHSDISASKVIAAANQFVSLGLKNAGYQYVNIDVRLVLSAPKNWIWPFFNRTAGRRRPVIRTRSRLYRTPRSSRTASVESRTQFIRLVSRSGFTGTPLYVIRLPWFDTYFLVMLGRKLVVDIQAR